MKKFRIYLWIISFVGRYKWPFVLLIMAGFLQSASLLTIPKMLQHIIDVVIPSGDVDRLIPLAALLVPLVIVMLGAMAVRNVVQIKVQEHSASDLQLALFSQLRKLGFAYYEKHPIGETLSMFQAEIPAIQQIYRRYLPVLIERIALLSISSVILLTINAKLTLLIIPFFLSYYLIGPHFERKQSRYSREGSASRTAFNKKIYDSLSGLLELRTHRAEKWDMDQLVHRYEQNRKLWLKELLYALLRGTARRVTINGGALFLFLFGAFSVRNGTMQAGEFVAFLLYYLHIMGDLTRVVTMVTEQSMLLAQGEKLYDLMNQQPQVKERNALTPLADVQGELSFDNVYFAYDQMPDRQVLSGLSVDIRQGQRVAFVGTSGGGKSTVLKLIGRFYDPQEGEIRLDGRPVRELSLEQLRNSLGFVFQETYLFGTSIIENIRFGNPDASDEAVIEAAKAANAHSFILQSPEGYNSLVGERGIKLSGGQKQRIAIARMILKNPVIIILDEATSSLDTLSEKEVQEALDRLMKGRTTVAVAHRLSTVRHYDQIVVMEDGKVVEMGTYDELYAKQGALYELVQGRKETVHV